MNPYDCEQIILWKIERVEEKQKAEASYHTGGPTGRQNMVDEGIWKARIWNGGLFEFRKQ